MTSLAVLGALLGAAVPGVAQDSFGTPPPAQEQTWPQQQQSQQQTYPPQQQQTYPPQQQGGQQQQAYPPQQQQQMPAQTGFGQQPPVQQQGTNLDQLSEMERQDYGVAATAQLHTGELHGPTPNSIPGGQVITTKGLLDLINGRQLPVLILDVLGGQEIIPNAQYAVPAHAAGSFNDQTQQQFGQYLQQATGGNKQYPLVLYCLSPQCWMSYNAALRAINLGYTNVLWYRGGIEAWKMAGQPVQAVQQQMAPAQQQQQQPTMPPQQQQQQQPQQGYQGYP
jgi:PQQ-dependent catabolism-associated CXXCW motif protein